MDELRTDMPNQNDIIPGQLAGHPSPLERLRSMWLEALPETAPQVDDGLDELINCDVVSIRYALLTQLLGKLDDHRRDALSIQRGDAAIAEAAGHWDARSFCRANVVPWVAEAGQVLGTSPDPYVNNPLRRPRLDAGYEARNRIHRPLWGKLVDILREVQEKDDPAYTAAQLRLCLAALVRKYNALTVQFDVPQRISLADAVRIVMQYLAEPSGGERPQIIVAALLRTIGRRFGIFDRVARQAINEADAAADRPGDVACYQGNRLIFAVEVKDREITLQDLDTAIGKARRSEVTELLFASVSSPAANPAIAARVQREFGLGINIYQLHIDDLLRVALSVAGEASRTEFLSLVGAELNDRVTQPAHKLAWQHLLRGL